MRRLLFVYFLSPILIYGQTSAITVPEIGKACPDFALTNIQYYNKDKVTLSDFRGKHLILDFFSQGCTSCFASFPKVNLLQKEFQDRVDIILVGSARGDKIKETYEKFRSRQKLDLAVTYELELLDRWEIHRFPHILWIDDKGIVKAITAGDLSAQNIQAFLEGKDFDFFDKSKKATTKMETEYNHNKPFLVDGNGGKSDDFLFRSLLAEWKGNTSIQIPSTIDSKDGRFECLGSIPWHLYRLAYTGSTYYLEDYGKFFHLPFLEVEDSIHFRFDTYNKKNVFNYSLIVPSSKATREYLMGVMQRDLKDYFGYEVSIEKRIVPYWRLIADKPAKKRLANTSGTVLRNVSHTGFSLKNVPMKEVILTIWGYHQMEPPFIDETGIDYNIDLEIDVLLTDLKAIQKAFRKKGLILERGTKEMPAIVIRDPQQPVN